MTTSVLRFNFAAPDDDGALRHERLTAALEMGAWADTQNIAAISIDEHHASKHGWSNNPVMTAAAFASRTTRVALSVDCALGPLWHPIRLAEDIAWVDALSGGRLIVTIGVGYRPVEYELFGVPFGERGKVMDNLLETMLEAWASEDFTPRPFTKPHPFIFVGGGVKATAERAAKFGLALNIPRHAPEVADHYRQLATERGNRPLVVMPAERSRGMVYLHEDPEKAWAELGEHLLWESAVYSGWAGGKLYSYMHGDEEIRTVDDVRAAGRYRFMTPADLVADVRDNPRDPIVLHPMVGAMPIDEAWKSLQLLVDDVLPALDDR